MAVPWTYRDMQFQKTKQEAANSFAVDSRLDASTAFFVPSNRDDWPAAVRNFVDLHPGRLRSSLEFARTVLSDYQDKDLVLYIYTHGIRIKDPRFSIAPFRVPNSKSAKIYEQQLASIFAEDIEKCRTFIPPPELRSDFIHRVACLFREEKNKFRDIHDLSAPKGCSVNDAIRFLAFHWTKSDDLSQRIVGNQAACRFDVKDYYKNFSVDPADWHLLASSVVLKTGEQPTEVWDTCMPFGLRSAVEIAHRMSTAIVYVINKFGIENVFTILDDFLKLSSCDQSGSPVESNAYDIILQIFKNLGFPLNMKPHKTHSWKSIVDFNGWEWDMQIGTVRMNDDKSKALLAELTSLLAVKRTTAKTVMHIAGKLVWASEVIWGGRTFSQPWLDAAVIANKMEPFHHLKINARMKESLHWWLHYFSHFNGTRKTLGRCSEQAILATDATGDGSIGIFLDADHYFYMTGEEVRSTFDFAPAESADIYIHEAFAMTLGLEIFGYELQNKFVSLYTDNPATARMLKWLAHRIEGLQNLAFRIFASTEKHNIRFSDVQLIPGTRNQLADALSRQQISRFFALLSTFDGTVI